MAGGGGGGQGGAAVWLRAILYGAALTGATFAVVCGSEALSAAAEEEAAASLTDVAMPGAEFAAGAALYRAHCANCHGATGDGDGPLAVGAMKPRSFRREAFRFPSTVNGVPTREDVLHVVHVGIPSAGMPPTLPVSKDDQALIADYVLELRRVAGHDEAPGELLELPVPPDGFEADPARGAEVFARLCVACHGADGAGNPDMVLVDMLGREVRPRDLRLGEFRGGDRDVDLYRRIRQGMPPMMTPFGPDQIGDDEALHLIAFVRSLSAQPAE